MSIQRREPRIETPPASTSSSEPITSAVDRAPVAAVDVRVDRTRRDHADARRRRVDALAHDVVVRVARDVVARDAGRRPQPVGEQRRDGGEQHPVEPARRAPRDVRRRRRARGGPAGRRGDSSISRVFPTLRLPRLLPKYCSKPAAPPGAAAVAAVAAVLDHAQTTIVGSSARPVAAPPRLVEHWPPYAGLYFSAVPVLPAIGIG